MRADEASFNFPNHHNFIIITTWELEKSSKNPKNPQKQTTS